MLPIKLIIFDFDGVVVDSEHLSSAVHAETLQQIGVPLTARDIDLNYTGLDFASMMTKLMHDYGIDKANLFANLIEENYAIKMRAELKLMPYIGEFLGATDLQICIASNSKMIRLMINQKATGIDAVFDDLTFSADMVRRPKPAPDLFLYAAQQMKIPTTNCLVIEDGAHGIKAANAASMRSIGFNGGSHCTAGHDQRLMDAGALHCFDDMSELTQIIKDIDNGKY